MIEVFKRFLRRQALVPDPITHGLDRPFLPFKAITRALLLSPLDSKRPLLDSLNECFEIDHAQAFWVHGRE